MINNKIFIILISFFWNSISFASTFSSSEINKILNYYKHLEKGKHKPKLSNRAIEALGKGKEVFKEESQLISLQNKIHKGKFNIKNCKNDSALKNDVQIYQSLLVLRFCHAKLLKKKYHRLSGDEKNFLKSYYTDLIKNKYLGILSFKKRKSVFPKILTEVLSLNEFDIDEIAALFKNSFSKNHIKVDEKMTKHLQEAGIFPAKESRAIKRTFRRMVSKLKKTKDKESYDKQLEVVLAYYKEHWKMIGHKYGNKKFRQISRTLIRNKREVKAKVFINRAILVQHKSYRMPLYFERLYIDLVDNKFKKSLKYIGSSGLLSQEDDYSSQVRFWVAKVYFETGNLEIAEFLFKKQISKKPLSYYSVLSSAHLQKMGKTPFLERNYFYKKQNDIFLNPPPENMITDIERLKLWIKIGNTRLTNLEVKSILAKTSVDSKKRNIASQKEVLSTSYQILKVFHDEENYLKSFRFFSRSKLQPEFDFLPSATKILFPTPFYDKIKKLSKKVDPVLIISLIRQESAFNTRARSSAGARGLMQLMPPTARMYRKRLKKSDLYKPELNLKIGIKYFSKLYHKYDKSLIYSLASYNAGETNLRRWKKKYFSMTNKLLQVESIPFHETEHYIKNITRNIFFYQLTFGKPLLEGLDWVKNET